MFALTALAALALAILSLSSKEGVFSARYHLVGYYENVQGLIPNAPVWLAGTRVGRVESVHLGTRGDGKPAVKVVLEVDESVQDRVRRDSTASIGTIGLLGDRYVEISLGSPSEAQLEDGAEISVANPANLARVMDTGTQALNNIATLAKNLNALVVGFEGDKGGKGIASSIASVADITAQIQNGDGLLHSLIYDQYEGGGVESIEKSLVTFEGILDEVATGNGLLHSLVYEPLTEQDVVLEALDAGARLNSILAKVDTGEGTIGLLLNDPTLYEDLKRLVGGAQRSTVVRTLIRMSGDPERVDP
jgi:phospholipid/cholesterol/gamma-HCH transport system substrate-binding protein